MFCLLHLGNPEYFVEKSEGVTRRYARITTPMGVLVARVVNNQGAWVLAVSPHCHAITAGPIEPRSTSDL